MEILQLSGTFWKNPIIGVIIILVATYAISFLCVSIFKKYFQTIGIIPENFCLNRHFSVSLWL